MDTSKLFHPNVFITGHIMTVNLALNQPSIQSTTRRPGVGRSSAAVDGDVNPTFQDRSCTETSDESDPWWAVDLTHNIIVYHVKVTNRLDCCRKCYNKLGCVEIFINIACLILKYFNTDFIVYGMVFV